MIRFLAALKYSILPHSQSSSKKTEQNKSRGLILEENYGSGGAIEIFVIARNGFQHNRPLVMLF